MPEHEDRPAGVSLAAVVLCLLICFGAIGLIGSIAVLFFTRNPLVPRIPSVLGVLGGFDFLAFCFLVWCAWTVLGLFRLRSSARISIVVIGALDFLFFALLCGAILYARRSPIVVGMDAHPNPAMPFPIGATLLALALIYGAFALIGLWWVVYFNLRQVRDAFAVVPRNSPRLTP